MSETGLGCEKSKKALVSDNADQLQQQLTQLGKSVAASDVFIGKYLSWVVTDLNGVIKIFNAGAERMLRCIASEVVNQKNIVDFFNIDELTACAVALNLKSNSSLHPAFDALVFKASRGNEDLYDLIQIRSDYSRFPAAGAIVALRDAKDGITGYSFISRDNSHQKEVELAKTRALLERETNAQRILDTASDAFVTMDEGGLITDWNVQAERIFGWFREDVVGHLLADKIVSPPFRTAHVKGLAHFLATGEGPVLNKTIEVMGYHRDGYDIPIELSVWAVKTSKGYVFNSFIRDLTQRKEVENQRILEQKLRAKNIQLEHSSRMKSEFLATMSHELRTPLNAIIGFSEALKDGLIGPMSEFQKEYIGDIFSSGQHLLSLINDILDLSKVEAGMMALEVEPVDLDLLLLNSLSIVKASAFKQRIKLKVEVADDLGTQQLDARKIKQIIYNLLANAVKFTAHGGCVTLHARRVVQSRVGKLDGSWPVHTFPQAMVVGCDDFLEIFVIDTGIGISQMNMPKLFQAFSQIDSSLARKFEGTGLGLAMVKRLTEIHGGSVAMSSAEGEGSCFGVWIPLCKIEITDTTNNAAMPALTL